MDTIRKELVDDQRAQDIFPRVNARLAAERIKNDEKYIALLIEEINNYFADLSTSTIDTSNLPNAQTGPIVANHNKLLVNTVTDIDKVHSKRVQVQDVITKAFNYLETERITLDNAVSKLYSKIVNQQMRSSLNDKNITVFSEYFTDNTFVDPNLSTNIVVDPMVSALTLSTTSENDDNSDLIDPTSIYMQVKLNKSVQDIAAAIYPIGAGEANPDHSLYAGFGRTLSTDDGLTSTNTNLNSAGIDPSKFINIQNTCLVNNPLGMNAETSATFGEFELIFNDFQSGKIRSNIITAIKSSNLNTLNYVIDDAHVFIDDQQGNSFHMSKNNGKASDSTTLENMISSIGLTFKLNEGSAIPGYLSYINIAFAPADTCAQVPIINYSTSYIKDVNGAIYFPFREFLANTTTNIVTSSKTLLLDSLVLNPVEFYIDFNMNYLNIKPISSYDGICWRVKFTGSTTTASFGVNTVSAVSERYMFIYHDINRYAQPPVQTSDLNFQALKTIMNIYDTTNSVSQGS